MYNIRATCILKNAGLRHLSSFAVLLQIIEMFQLNFEPIHRTTWIISMKGDLLRITGETYGEFFFDSVTWGTHESSRRSVTPKEFSVRRIYELCSGQFVLLYLDMFHHAQFVKLEEIETAGESMVKHATNAALAFVWLRFR